MYVMTYIRKKDVEILNISREILDDTKWIFFNWECSSISYRDNSFKYPILS